MSTMGNSNRTHENEIRFRTIRGNRNLRIIETDFESGLRNFKYSNTKQNTSGNHMAIILLKAMPWLMIGLVVTFMILIR
jgi:hypothetical protein